MAIFTKSVIGLKSAKIQKGQHSGEKSVLIELSLGPEFY
jgi:hypothetical protein